MIDTKMVDLIDVYIFHNVKREKRIAMPKIKAYLDIYWSDVILSDRRRVITPEKSFFFFDAQLCWKFASAYKSNGWTVPTCESQTCKPTTATWPIYKLFKYQHLTKKKRACVRTNSHYGSFDVKSSFPLREKSIFFYLTPYW